MCEQIPGMRAINVQAVEELDCDNDDGHDVGVWVHVDVILQPHLWRATQVHLKQLQGHPCCALQQSQETAP